MVIRYVDICFYAIDDCGNLHNLSREYHYASGYVRLSSVEMNNQEYVHMTFPVINETKTDGKELPLLNPDDLSSYFTPNLTPDLKKALNVAKLSHLNITKFLMIYVESVSAGPYRVSCFVVTKDDCIEHKYNFVDYSLDEVVDDIVMKLIREYYISKWLITVDTYPTNGCWLDRYFNRVYHTW